MVRLPTLFPGEKIVETCGIDVQRDGFVIGCLDRSTVLLDFQTAMLRLVAVGCGLNQAEQARLIGAKQCISCGAYQNINGDLPCDH